MKDRFIKIHGPLDFIPIDELDDGSFGDFEGLAVPHHRVALGTPRTVESIDDMVVSLIAAKSNARVDWSDDEIEAAERELESNIRYLKKLDEVGYEVETAVDLGPGKWVVLTGGPMCDDCERRLDFQEVNGEYETVCRICE